MQSRCSNETDVRGVHLYQSHGNTTSLGAYGPGTIKQTSIKCGVLVCGLRCGAVVVRDETALELTSVRYS